MKKRNLLLLFTLPTLALCGCTIGKKDTPEEEKEEPTTNPDTENLDGNDVGAYSLDISDYTGSYYVCVDIKGVSSNILMPEGRFSI